MKVSFHSRGHGLVVRAVTCGASGNRFNPGLLKMNRGYCGNGKRRICQIIFVCSHHTQIKIKSYFTYLQAAFTGLNEHGLEQKTKPFLAVN